MTPDLIVKVAAMTAVRELADLEVLTLGDHCLFTNMLPVVTKAIETVMAQSSRSYTTGLPIWKMCSMTAIDWAIVAKLGAVLFAVLLLVLLYLTRKPSVRTYADELKFESERDRQRWLNYQASRRAERVVLQPKSPFIGSTLSKEDYERLAKAWNGHLSRYERLAKAWSEKKSGAVT